MMNKFLNAIITVLGSFLYLVGSILLWIMIRLRGIIKFICGGFCLLLIWVMFFDKTSSLGVGGAIFGIILLIASVLLFAFYDRILFSLAEKLGKDITLIE